MMQTDRLKRWCEVNCGEKLLPHEIITGRFVICRPRIGVCSYTCGFVKVNEESDDSTKYYCDCIVSHDGKLALANDHIAIYLISEKDKKSKSVNRFWHIYSAGHTLHNFKGTDDQLKDFISKTNVYDTE